MEEDDFCCESGGLDEFTEAPSGVLLGNMSLFPIGLKKKRFAGNVNSGEGL